MDTKKEILNEVGTALVALHKYAAQRMKENTKSKKNYNYYSAILNNARFLFEQIDGANIDEKEVNDFLQGLNYLHHKAIND